MYRAEDLPWLRHVYSDPPRPMELAVDESALERKFPRVAQELCERWKNPGIVQYLDDLVMDWRGNRHGFPPDVVQELLVLNGVLFNLTLHKDRFFPKPIDGEFAFGGKSADMPRARARRARAGTRKKKSVLERITRILKLPRDT